MCATVLCFGKKHRLSIQSSIVWYGVLWQRVSPSLSVADVDSKPNHDRFVYEIMPLHACRGVSFLYQLQPNENLQLSRCR